MALKLASDDDFAQQHEINLTPFIDVVLVLLIIFMVVAPLSTASVDVDLPDLAAAPRPLPEKPVELTLDAGGTVYLGDGVLATGAIAQAVDGAAHGNHDTRIFLRVDRKAQMGPVMAAMDALRHGGYNHIGLLGMAGGAPS